MIGVTEVEMVAGAVVAIFAVLATCWAGVKAIREALSPLSNLFETVQQNERDIKQLKSDVSAIKLKLNTHNEYLRKDNGELKRQQDDLRDLRQSNLLLLRGISKLIKYLSNGGDESILASTEESIDEYLLSRKV